ncbi:hypothetical protein D3C78_1463960 [compost metagenome]
MKHGQNLRLNFLLWHVSQAKAKRNVIEYIQVRKECIPLEDHVDTSTLRRKMCRIQTTDKKLTLRGLFKSGDDPHQSCLTTAARSQQGQNLPFLDLKIDVIQSREWAERFPNVVQFHDVLAHLLRPSK